jgi:hypothetical protein
MGLEVDCRNRPAEDFARATVRYLDKAGTPLLVEATTSWSYVGAGLRLSLELLGPEQGLMPVVGNEAAEYGYEGENRHFVRCFADGVQPELDFRAGLDVVELLMTCYMSTEEERVIDWRPAGLDAFVPAVARRTWKPQGKGGLMHPRRFAVAAVVALAAFVWAAGPAVAGDPPPGFVSLFNGKDFTGWKVPAGDNGHWKVVDGVIDYDAQSEAAGEKHLWSTGEYGDFVLRLDWRIKETPWVNPNVPIVRYDGTHKKGPDGKEIRLSVPDSDSGVYLRGTDKAQVNIWCWPIGSGEVYGYRMDEKQPAAVRAGVTPKANADRDIGEWNTFEITMKGDRLTVVLNGVTVLENAQLPGVPARGRIALQHHGAKTDGKWNSPPALVQFRNVFVKELK